MRQLRLVVLALVLAMPVTAVPPAAAQPSQSPEVIEIAVDLGPGVATAVNVRGVVVGNADFKPWVWRNGTRSYLPTLGGSASALAINVAGDVVGWAEDGDGGTRVGVRWTRGNIEVLEGFSIARDVNDRGEIVGNGPAGALHHWNGTTTVLPHGGQAASANAINQQGLIVGQVDQNAVAWRDGTLEQLPVTGGWPESGTTSARDVSDRGHIVGNRSGAYPYSAFRLSPDGTYEELAPGRLGGYLVAISAVDQFGRAVGQEVEESTSFALAWLPGEDRPLQLGSYRDDDAWMGWWPSAASDISDRGVVVGSMRNWWTGEFTAVMWQLPR